MTLRFLSRHALTLSVVVASTGISYSAWSADMDATFKKAGTFGALMETLRETNLEPKLTEPGPYTIFAPSDEAFAKLPSSIRERLRHDKAWAKHVMEGHIVVGKHLLKNESSPTVELAAMSGGTLKLQKKKEEQKKEEDWVIGDAEVLEPDVEVDNGVINVIDTVILPAN